MLYLCFLNETAKGYSATICQEISVESCLHAQILSKIGLKGNLPCCQPLDH